MHTRPVVRSWVEISRNALLHNIRLMRSQVSPRVKLFAVVKSDAYGHSMKLVSHAIAKHVDAFCVANTKEALELRTIQKKKRVIVLSYFTTLEKKHIPLLVQKGIEVPLADFTTLQHLKRSKQPVQAHLKIDTGTSRIGFQPTEIPRVLRLLRSSNIRIVGVFSHFNDIENLHSSYYKTQHKKFCEMVTLVRKIAPTCEAHISCSAGITRSPAIHHDAVRLGIHLFGFSGISENTQVLHSLKPVLRWKARVLQIKSIPRGVRVGYNKTFIAPHTIKIATLPIGYWDGYPRSLSNKGYALFGRHKLPVRGSVCMNVTMVEVPNRAPVRAETVVDVFGSGRHLVDMAERAGTIHYELLSRIHPAIPRYLV